VRFEFKFGIVSFCFSFIFVSFGESRLLVLWCAGGRCNIVCSNEDLGRSRRPCAEYQRWSHRSSTRWPGDQEVGWCRVQSAPCMWRRGARVFWLSLKTKVDGLSSKPLRRFVSGLASKSLGLFLIGLGLKTDSDSL
jgi:hypothetical protein